MLPLQRVFKNLSLSTADHISMFFAELVGTGFLTFFGCGCTIQWDDEPLPPMHKILAFGTTVFFIIQIFGHISAAHLNPAITVSAVVQGVMSIGTAIYYLIAQYIGAVTGFGLLQLIVPQDIFNRPDLTEAVCATVLRPGVTPLVGVLIEFVTTSVIILSFCAFNDARISKQSETIPLKFAFIIFACTTFAAPFTGASFNPARTFGPSLFNNDWDNQWIYWVGPLSAGVIAPLFYKVLFWRPDADLILKEELTKVEFSKPEFKSSLTQ